jgi:ribulose-5-phosphate 4-epimerase/fuculose-1-phosphate aldolase
MMCASLLLPAPDSAHAAQGGAADPAVIAELVLANHILFDQGVVDAYGHVSVRHDKRADRYLLARNVAPSDVTAADIIEFTLDSAPVSAGETRLYSERFIHGEIYRARPDIVAVVHSHSMGIVALSLVANAQLKPVMHLSGFIGEAAPRFEIRDAAGPASNMLVQSGMLGAALAKTLGGNSVVVMRGHGSAAVGRSLHEAVYRAVYSDVNARLQLDAMKAGPVTYLSPGEVRATREPPNIERAWEFWKAQSLAKQR